MNALLLRSRLTAVFCVDIAMTILAWIMASFLCTNFQAPSYQTLLFLPQLMLIQGCAAYFCGLYRGVWRFASIPDLIRIIKAVILGVSGAIIVAYYTKVSIYFTSITITYCFLLILFLSAPRVVFRWLKNYQRFFQHSERLLIVGAGSAGESIVRDLHRFHPHQYQAIAFVDDNPQKLGQEIHGVRVKGEAKDIPKLVNALQINLILIAMPSASSADMRRVVNLCEQSSTPFRTLPSLNELTEGRVTINTLRDVSLSDLLGREEVHLTWDKIKNTIKQKTIVVTGGGGSIGGELCIQIAALKPKHLIIIDKNEYNLYQIDMKLREYFPELKLSSVLCSVTDRPEINHLFAQFRPEIIFHAAAYKHVPLLESQLRVAIYNNIIGTRVLAEAASEHNSEAFVLISTDKAVNPVNVMGATKRGAEIFCQYLNNLSLTRFITVRFGNVLDSAGSVVPLFRSQLQKGGPLTVTHPDMNRFFMTIQEASQLIMQASSMGEGGEIFVLNMGEPVKIRYLAEQLIKLSGKNLDEDIAIRYTGLRPGEKLSEELFYQEEKCYPTLHPKIYQAKSTHNPHLMLIELLNSLESAYAAYDEKKLLTLLCRLVPEYQSPWQTRKPFKLKCFSSS